MSENDRPQIRKVVTPCECGWLMFNLEYGQPITCVECGTVPDEIRAQPLSEDRDYELVVDDPNGPTHVQTLHTEEW